MDKLPFRPVAQIKFVNQAGADSFYAILRARVQEWMQATGRQPYATTETWIKGGIYALLLVGSYVALLTVRWGLGWSYFFWALYGLSALFMVYNIGHDAAHGALSSNRRLNHWLFVVSFNLLGVSAYLWRLRHLHSHHQFPNVNGCDADIDANPFVRLSPNHPRRRYMRWQHLYAHLLYPLVNLHSIIWNDWLYLKARRLANMDDLRHPLREWLIFFGAKLAFVVMTLVLPRWTLGLSWGEALAGFLLMNAAISAAFVYMNIVNHFSSGSLFPAPSQGGLGHSWAVHQLATTVDYWPLSRWCNWLTGGFNAHAAHHLFPQVCHTHYPQISRLIAQTAAELGLPYTAVSYWKALRLHQRLLYNLGHYESPPEGPYVRLTELAPIC